MGGWGNIPQPSQIEDFKIVMESCYLPVPVMVVLLLTESSNPAASDHTHFIFNIFAQTVFQFFLLLPKCLKYFKSPGFFWLFNLFWLCLLIWCRSFLIKCKFFQSTNKNKTVSKSLWIAILFRFIRLSWWFLTL